MQSLLIILLIHVYGYITGEDNRSIEFVNAYSGTGSELIGTSSNKNGFYDLLLERQDTITLTFSMVGYVTVVQRIIQPGDVVNVNVQMLTDERMLEEVQVRGMKRQQGTLEHMDATATRLMPDATGGSIESMLITFAGVHQNNELSTQYNVRGGSFDENSVYVNGIEVHRPLLIRSGQQEGLSFVNPYMVENVEFSAGGYDACYGDKMSSVLDITYKRPTCFEANLTASLLGASVYVGHGNEHFSQMHGLRYKTSKYMLGALQTVGNYNPTYLDYQTSLNWGLNSRKETNRPWRMSFLGNVSINTYSFRPDSLTENIGGLTNLKNLSIWYEGQEQDRFVTAFGALSAEGKVGDETSIGFDISGFYTNEQENFDIKGDYILSEGDGKGITDISGSTVSGNPDGEEAPSVLAVGTYMQHARNTLTAGVVTLAHHGEWAHDDNNLRWGISAQGEFIRDRISEWEMRDSAGYSVPNHVGPIDLYYSMSGEADMRSVRAQGYLMNTHKWDTPSGRWILTAGVRLQYWSYNREWMPSPRASVTWLPGWKRDFAFRLASGLYYQAPFYKELRDTTTIDGVTRISLNQNIRAQRAAHTVLGADYYFRGAGRPFKFTAELYYKYIDRMISYTVDNVRVRYSGQNDAVGHSFGADLKLYGELVPGADSWVSFSAGGSRMRLLDKPQYGWIPSSQEQRWALTIFFQDYFPRLPQLKFHIKMIFADGLPYAQPRRIETQKFLRTDAYKRIDLGATYSFDRKTARFMRNESAKHVRAWNIGFEVFNIIGFNNVSSYFWASDVNNNVWRSPNYLTGRRFNLKISVDLQ